MFTEYEVQTFLTIPEIAHRSDELRKEFIREEAHFLEISNHDFLSLILMTPVIGIANANNNISLFEEISLNKMARKMSKGGYFMSQDPVAKAMQFLIKDFDKWEPVFLNTIKEFMRYTFDFSCINTTIQSDEEIDFDVFPREIMVVPYILVRCLSSFFLQGEVEIVEHHSILKVEYEKIISIGKALEIDHLNIFKAFLTTFNVR